ncbi:4860_t:CDS:2, partial [Gigaspora rosea]
MCVNEILGRTSLPAIVTDSEQLNRCWNVWANAVQQAANRHIPKTYIAPKTFYALSLKASKLHTALTHINKCLHILAKAASPVSITSVIQQANKHLSRALTAAQIPKFSLTPLALATKRRNQTIKGIKEIKTIIWRSRNAELSQTHTETQEPP